MRSIFLVLVVFLCGGMTLPPEPNPGPARGVDPCTLFGSVFVEEVESFADFRVFRDDVEGTSDLTVFREQARSFADRPGLWHFTNRKGLADFTISFTEVRGFADFSIHISEFKSLAGCRN